MQRVILFRSGNNLVMKFANAGDQITFSYWYDALSERLSSLEFADGTIWGEAAFLPIHGTANADTISGNTGSDTLYGENGNDLLYGNDSTDILVQDCRLTYC